MSKRGTVEPSDMFGICYQHHEESILYLEIHNPSKDSEAWRAGMLSTRPLQRSRTLHQHKRIRDPAIWQHSVPVTTKILKKRDVDKNFK